MARFGRGFLQAATQPSFGQGLFTAAQQIGAAPGRRRAMAEAEAKKAQLAGMLKGVTPGTAEYSSILADYYSEVEKDPQKANTLGALARQQAETEADRIRNKRILSNLRAAGKAKASKSSNADDLIPLVDSMSASELRQYLMPSTPSEFTLSKGQVRFRGGEKIASVEDTPEIKYVTDDLLNVNTGNVESVRIGYQGNKEVSREVLGVVPRDSKTGGAGIEYVRDDILNPETNQLESVRVGYLGNKEVSREVIGTVPFSGAGGAGGAGGKQTLAQFFKDKGIEVDLDTIEGLQQAQQAAYFYLSNAALANSIGTIIEQKKDPGVKEGLDILQTQPEVKQAQEDLVLVNKFKSLAPLTEVDTAGASRLLQRIVTATAPNDLKAVAELNAFTSAQGLKDRVDDFFSMVITGQLSEETIREYQNTINAIEELSNRQITNAARRLSIYGNEREQKAAQNVLNFYGASTARVVSE